MKLYLDDDTASPLLATLLHNTGHDVQLPGAIGMSGAPDAVHLTRAIADGRVCVTKNYDDFLILHNLIKQAAGHHPGIFVVRQDNDPTRDLTPKGIVTAIRKLETAGVPIADELSVLNHWR
jgi:predicted nuclease of predicted toxin-antitoxin system